LFDEYLRILWLLNEAGPIVSRKKIQKIVYLLQQKGIHFDEHFSLHLYGPYSSELQIELDQLDEMGLIEQNTDSDIYRFQITDRGKEVLEKNGIDATLDADAIQLINDLKGIEPFILELMSTIIYFEKSYGNEREVVRRALGEIKPHLMDKFDEAWGLLDSLGLHFSG